MSDSERYEKARKRRRDAPQWKKQLAIELLTPKRKRFQRRKIYSPSVDAIWTGDLMDIHKYARQNKNYKFILVLVDIFSRYAWARPLKNKSATSTAEALKDVFTSSIPKKLWTDEGTEFYNNTVNRILKEHNIELYSTHNDVKAAIAERFIRTLRRKIESNFILTHSTVWYDILPQLIYEYNTTIHTTLKMTPQEARRPRNFTKVYEALYNQHTTSKERIPTYLIGDKVRISIYKRIFEKEASATWSEEIFEISDILMTQPIVYKIKDLSGEELKGTFYKEQLQKTDQSIYRIDRILRRRQRADGTREVLVKWMGWPDKFNSWEPEDTIYRSSHGDQ